MQKNALDRFRCFCFRVFARYALLNWHKQTKRRGTNRIRKTLSSACEQINQQFDFHVNWFHASYFADNVAAIGLTFMMDVVERPVIFFGNHCGEKPTIENGWCFEHYDFEKLIGVNNSCKTILLTFFFILSIIILLSKIQVMIIEGLAALTGDKATEVDIIISIDVTWVMSYRSLFVWFFLTNQSYWIIGIPDKR